MSQMDCCDRCLGFVEDFLLFPQHPFDELHKRERPKRLRHCVKDVSKILLEILTTVPQCKYEEIETYDRFVNGERRINPAQITADDLKWLYSRCVRFYYKFQYDMKHKKPLFDIIVTLLQENMILRRCYDRYYYEQWLAQKFVYLLQNLKQIHKEHGGKETPNLEKAILRVTIPTVPTHWYDLYD